MRNTIDMAREVKATAYTNRHYPERTTYTFGPEQLKAFEALVRADQREIDAKVCEELVPDMSRTANDASVWDVATFDCAIAIRNRGNT
jgi:hypothetical protein